MSDMTSGQNMLLVLGIAVILGLIAYLGWLSYGQQEETNREETPPAPQMK